MPCHYINPDCDEARDFNHHLEKAKGRGERVPRSVVLKPGEVLEIDN